jgi:hypothetical protein
MGMPYALFINTGITDVKEMLPNPQGELMNSIQAGTHLYYPA